MEILVRRALPFAGLALLGALVMPAFAKEGDTFRPFVSYSRHFDSNLFRLDESEYAGVSQRSDQYGVLGAGLNVDWQPGRQRIVAGASRNQVRFARNTQLDYDGSDYQLKWLWRLGNRWSGQLGAMESVTQSSFSDLVGLRINNQITRDNRFASADWQLHPRWHVGLGTATVSSTNSTVERAPLDYEEHSVSAMLGYATPRGSKLRGELRRLDGEYPNRLPGVLVDRAYVQTEYNLLGDWNMSGKLVTHAKAGYVKRENDTIAQRDFSGVAGRLSADYFPTGKTALNAAIYREIANSDDLNATYQVNTGTRLGAAWEATGKVMLRADLTFENRRFDGDTGQGATALPQRDEDTLGGSLSMRYAPLRMLTLDLGLLAGRRHSSMARNDYTFHGAFFSVRADF